MGILKTLTINGEKYSVTPIVPADSVTLLASAWVGEGDLCSQVVEVPGVTAHTKVDLQPTAEQLAEFHYKVLAFVAENDNGVVTVYSIGDKPVGDHTIQITKTEVEGTGHIRGNTVGTTTPRPDWEQTDPTKADYILNKPDDIVCEETGSVIDANDASNQLLHGLTLYGKTTQDGTPTPEAPVELVKAGASGSIVSTITDGTDSNVQTITAQTPNGLPGIPVASGGNYTDENGQQWICDEIDFARGVYVQRVRELDFATFNWKATAYSNEVQKGYYAKVIGFYNSRNNFFHTHYRWLGYLCGSGAGSNALGTTQSVFNARTIGEIGFLTKAEGQDYFGVVVGINDGTPVGTLQLVCVEPIETPLSAEELAQYAALHSNKPETVAYNDAGAGMKIAYVADTKLYIDKKFNELAAAIVNNA